MKAAKEDAVGESNDRPCDCGCKLPHEVCERREDAKRRLDDFARRADTRRGYKPRGGAANAGGALALLLALVLGACVPVEAITQAETQHAIEVGHAGDESLPLPARQRAADSARAWDAQHVSLTGDRAPIAEQADALLAAPELAPVTTGGP